MKMCPSCGSEVADDAKECLCGYSYEEAGAELGSADEGGFAAAGEASDFDEPSLDDFGGDAGAGGMPATKACVFCMSEIAAPALRCPHCSGFLPIAEGTIFKQYFFFLFSCLALALGCLLPWERSYLVMNLTGIQSITGGFLFVLAVYGIFASYWNIYHRKMIVWPVILAALDGAIFGISRMVKILNDTHVVITAQSDFGQFVQKVRGHAQAIGPGLYLVVLFSVLVILSVFLSVFKGAKQDARRKEIEREARLAARKQRRS